jgi:hypothetical protein
MSPGVPDSILAGACLIAAGILKSNATFPDLPPAEKAMEDASLFLAGMHVGRDDRMRSEKESCQGVS